MRTNFDVSSIALRFAIGGGAMKYNINVIKSVWRRVRKPNRATLDAVSSKNAVYTEVFSETDILAEQTDLTMVANLNKAGWGWLCRSPGFSRANSLQLLTNMATKSVSLAAGRM
jgi:hypothetical protein